MSAFSDRGKPLIYFWLIWKLIDIEIFLRYGALVSREGPFRGLPFRGFVVILSLPADNNL
jgi:hypothetical protein